MASSPKIKPPQPSAQEVAIQSQQIELMKKQVLLAEQTLSTTEKSFALQDALKPFVLQNMRLTQGEDGSLRRMTEDEYVATLLPTDRQAYANLRLMLERENKALSGALPLSEASQQRKRDEFTAFKEQMARAGNPITGDAPGAASSTTTAGAQALKAFNERWGLVEEAERRGELTAGSQSVLARLGIASDLGARNQESLLAAPGLGRGGLGGAGGALAPDFAGVLAPFERARQQSLAAQIENQRRRQQDKFTNAQLGASAGSLIGSIFGPVGSVAGGVIGGGAGYLAG